LDVHPPGGSDLAPQRLEATHAQATNKLLYAAPFIPAASGDWTLHVTVARGAESAQVECLLPVGPSRPSLVGIWPYLAIPPVAVALSAGRARGARRRRGASSFQSRNPPVKAFALVPRRESGGSFLSSLALPPPSTRSSTWSAYLSRVATSSTARRHF